MRRHSAATAMGILMITVSAVTAAQASPQISALKQRDLSEVRLLAVSRVPKFAMTAPAEDGLRLVFLVASRRAEATQPTLRELRDVTINDVSYRAQSTANYGQPIEPATVVIDISTLAEMDSTVRKFLPAESLTSIGMVVDIASARLHATGVVRLRLQAGWDGKLEDFEFEFDLSQVPIENPFSRYRPPQRPAL